MNLEKNIPCWSSEDYVSAYSEENYNQEIGEFEEIDQDIITASRLAFPVKDNTEDFVEITSDTIKETEPDDMDLNNKVSEIASVAFNSVIEGAIEEFFSWSNDFF